ncbi:MAG: DEAD/DEAH box helicase [Chitinophagales bacterium]
MTGTSFTRQVKRTGARAPRASEPALALDYFGDAAGLLPRLARGENDGAAAFLAAARPEEAAFGSEEPQVRLYPHQEQAVRRVLGELGGRALLADAVGLGKTIEAGAVLSEYRRRGLVERALILVPAALVNQWERELSHRFGLRPTVAKTLAGWRGELVLGSLDLAKRPAHARRLCQTPWDLVIVDEAHRLKNCKTAAWQLVHELEATYLLLLTATPVQNDLSELYNLVHLVQPGLLSTPAEFKRAFRLDKLHPKDAGSLRERLSRVMIRSDRRAAALCFPPRRVETLLLPQSEPEAELYAECLALLAEARRRCRTRQQVLPFVVLLREATSSPEAARRTLLRMARRPGLAPPLAARYREVAERGKAVRPLKAEALGTLLTGRQDKAIVFTEFRGTQDLLARELRRLGIPAVKYHGGMTPAAQEAAVEDFRGEARVLLATEAGAEGHNLQFCRWLVNFDLPWNPMRLEQRIGRVHRLGQEDAVEVTNLVTEGTIEGHVLRILGAKLEQCEAVLGELDLILDHGCERRITDLVLAAETPAELEAGFARLAREIEALRAVHARAAQRMDLLAGLAGDREDGEDGKDGKDGKGGPGG